MKGPPTPRTPGAPEERTLPDAEAPTFDEARTSRIASSAPQPHLRGVHSRTTLDLGLARRSATAGAFLEQLDPLGSARSLELVPDEDVELLCEPIGSDEQTSSVTPREEDTTTTTVQERPSVFRSRSS